MKILVPIDFSAHAGGAMRMAMYLANRQRASVAVLHVDPLPGLGTVAVEPIYIAPQMFAGLHAEHDARIDAELAEVRTQYLATAGDGVELAVVRRRDDVVPGILEFAREWQPDLMVMGTGGIDGLGRLLLGSTVDRVARVAPCPVLVAGRADDTGDTPRRFERVVAAIDYSAFSDPVARAAAAVVEPSGVLEFLHVWNPPHVSALSGSLGADHVGMLGWIERARAAQVDEIQSFSAELDCEHAAVAHYVGTGSPATGILERARASRADLIVLGTHSRAGLAQRILGTVAERVLRHAEIPVLLCPLEAMPGLYRSTAGPTAAEVTTARRGLT